MSEERILKSIEKMLDKKIGKVESRIDELDKDLSNKIDTVSQDLKDFKEETRKNFGLINERVDKFEDETRTNFVSMSQRLRHTNERITELDKKMEKGFQENIRAIGIAFNSAFESINRNYVKKEKAI